ncbi:eukaryotic translation initiation factor 5A [Striga asiatica]|uniref:Eukaryotic translation initiation factor 5A n=1 Tax=Striga asiatica TaxID=4170 RepID=A0A5A7Q676_STRAF|nr:eukaryotic translation initiation factor 5A [Striga asiatica]
MSDEEHHFESKADAGASKTYPQQAGTIRKYGHIVIKGRPCKVVEVSTSKTGKHGHAKCHFVAIDIFNGKKLEDIVPSSHNCDVPHVNRTDYQLIDISEDGFVSLLTENGNTKDDLRLPTDENLLSQIKSGFEEGKDLVVSVMSAMGEEQICALKDIAMDGDISQRNTTPADAGDGDNNEVPAELSQAPRRLIGKVEMVSKCDRAQDKELQSMENDTGICPKEPDKISEDPIPIPFVSKKKTTDEYNWRKYGQKHVKNPEGSRSYYRCTFSNCSAKKIECFDRCNCVTDVVYRSHHNHDPLKKVNCGTEFRPEINQITETKQHDSPDSKIKEETDCPKEERRQKRNLESEVSSLSENGKRRKFVVCEAIDDVSTPGDGYRWRKYGQKTVKGTPHPRNYYKCTSAGCTVRKHVEKATDNTSSVIITYKGVHNHELPVPKKRHGPKSPLSSSAATSPLSNDRLRITKGEYDPNRTEQQSAGEKLKSSGGEESTRTKENTSES